MEMCIRDRCKAISSIIWVIGSGLVAFISMLLLLVNKDVISSIISNFDIVVEMFKKLNSEVGIDLYIIPFEIIVIMLLSTLVFIFTLYASISIGHLFPRHRILGSFGGFILINMLGNIAAVSYTHLDVYKRQALGRAIVRKPSVFLMDEPLSNLDAKLREHMRIELVRIHKALGTTSIYVTHDQVEAMTMATKIVLMNDGKIQQVGKPYRCV